MKTKKKRRRTPPSSSDDPNPITSSSDDDPIASFDATLFPLLLASLSSSSSSSSSSSPTTLPLQLLRRLCAPLLRSPHPLPPSLLALFPLLLSSPSPSLHAIAARLLGSASLLSLHHNHAVAADTPVLKALIRLLSSRTSATAPEAAEAALTAIMDLSASSFARGCLRDLRALHTLIYMLCQEMSPHPHTHPIPINKFSASLLETALLLVNTSPIHFAHTIPEPLIRKALPLLSKIHQNAPACRKINRLCGRIKELLETMFRLSVALPDPTFSPQDLGLYFFGTNESGFQGFLLNFWEKSPVLLKKGSETFDKPDSFFGSVVDYVSPKSAGSITDSILQYPITCPAVVSDELDANQILNEIKGYLGSQLVYNQDIRIVKTEGQSHKKEDHFLFIDKYKEAFDNGYSIALKGMEFRSDEIAPFSLALSELFGLPSIGVNLYLSPCGAQGLARHYDDHCVLVWQIIGCKSWRILKEPKSVMPRLYESLDSTLANEKGGELEILLEEGDILYVPRGYFHEAHTMVNGSEPHKTDCSLHLTFAIEVERPFEWEGFVHVALHCWREKLSKESDNLYLNSNLKNITHTLLLHVAIKLISDHTPAFWKACMVASNFKIDDHRLTFRHLINMINVEANFMEAFNWVKLVLEKRDEDSIQCMRWLRNLYVDIDYDNMLETLEKYVLAGCCDKTEEAMVDFSLFKSMFCESAVYEDACASFKVLLTKYRQVRRQYMKGMLSLHRNY